jgi:hypothetical protein
MVQGKITDGDFTELVRSTADAASAYIRGDIQRYLTLIKHGDNWSIAMPTRSFTPSPWSTWPPSPVATADDSA